MTWEKQNAQQRILDPAIGPQQFTSSQRTFYEDKPAWGRADPLPADWNMGKMTRDQFGTGYYEDLFPDNDCWREGDGSWGSLFRNWSP